MSAAGDQRAGSPLPAARSPSRRQAGFRPWIRARTRRVSRVSGQGRPLPRRGGPAAIVSGSADATYPGVRCRDPPTGTAGRRRRFPFRPARTVSRRRAVASAGVRRSSPPCRNAAGLLRSFPRVTLIVVTRVAGPLPRRAACATIRPTGKQLPAARTRKRIRRGQTVAARQPRRARVLGGRPDHRPRGRDSRATPLRSPSTGLPGILRLHIRYETSA